MNRPVCVHCEKRKPNSTRGLCRACSDTPGVRDMYPCKSLKAHTRKDGVGLVGGYKLPPYPTDAPRGSAEKMAVMSERARMGVSLHHPDDNPDAGELACEAAA